ncbi:025R [Invertebrate iridescent virus Kaz2018]|uniref:Uncharacterized protein n=1 Tax=Iridovirus sp. TaxID=135728 RepID=A0AAU7YBK1_9VIRU|nr:025R [Invertebrate iridescent virus Kaz2018]
MFSFYKIHFFGFVQSIPLIVEQEGEAMYFQHCNIFPRLSQQQSFQ